MTLTAEGVISRMFENMPETTKAAMEQQDLLYNYHNYCIRSERLDPTENPAGSGQCNWGTCSSYQRARLDRIKILGTSTATNYYNGQQETFVNAVELADYPFYSLQVHHLQHNINKFVEV